MRRALALALLLPLEGCAALSANRLYPYECSVGREDAGGTFRIERRIARPGSTGATIASWHTPFGGFNSHLNLGVTWLVPDIGAEAGPPDDVDYYMSYHFMPAPPVRGHMEIGQGAPPFALVGPTRRISDVGMRVPAGRLRALASGGAGLTFRIVGENGTVIGAQTIDPALLDAPAAAIASAMPEFRAMVADYRTRCSSNADQIIVT